MVARRIVKREIFPNFVPPLSTRQRNTLLYLLRYEAEQQRRMHGKVPRGGILLTPEEMDQWAQEIASET
jgi:hypothetical protein